MTIELNPIGFVRNSRKAVEDDNWGGIISEIEITLGEDALKGIKEFSHAEIIFYFHEVDETKIVTGARHPRNNRIGRKWEYSPSAGRIVQTDWD